MPKHRQERLRRLVQDSARNRESVAPPHWRKGIGMLICQHAEHFRRGRGCALAALWVLKKNDQARRFYEAMGFEVDRASKTVSPGAPLEAVRYRKMLGRVE